MQIHQQNFNYEINNSSSDLYPNKPQPLEETYYDSRINSYSDTIRRKRRDIIALKQRSRSPDFKSYSQKWIEAQLSAKEAEINQALQTKFKANPLPVAYTKNITKNINDNSKRAIPAEANFLDSRLQNYHQPKNSNSLRTQNQQKSTIHFTAQYQQKNTTAIKLSLNRNQNQSASVTFTCKARPSKSAEIFKFQPVINQTVPDFQELQKKFFTLMANKKKEAQKQFFCTRLVIYITKRYAINHNITLMLPIDLI